MSHAQTEPDLLPVNLGGRLVDEVIGFVAGCAFTFLIFFGLAHVEQINAPTAVAEIEDLRMIAAPLEPPPPPPKLEPVEPLPEMAQPLAGLEIGASDSPISIAVIPPDLEQIIPATANPGAARAKFDLRYADLKPATQIDVDARHVYQEAEVDQRPHAIVRTVPLIPADVSGKASSLRVMLLLLIDQRGRVESARVVQSSGNSRFDEIVAHTVQDEWLFAPAMRRGKKVRVLAQQAFRVTFTGGSSPFGVD